ncbi:MAG: efflux RND transporter periplasmic adaptor subunit [Anaerolinea sp.]
MSWKKSILSAVLILYLAGCSALPWTQATPQPTPIPTVKENGGVVAEAKLAPNDSASVFFQTSGTVAEVLVKEGDTVRKGDVLARLSDVEQAEAVLAAAKAEELAARQALDTLNEKARLTSEQAHTALLEAERAYLNAWEALDKIDTDDTQDRIDDARKEVADREKELKDAREELDRYLNLSEDNATRKSAQDKVDDAQRRYDEAVRKRDRLINELETARAAFALAKERLEDASRTYEQRAEGKPDADDLALAEARLTAAQAQVRSAQAALDRLTLRAPFDGVVTEVRISAGEMVFPNTTALVVADFSTWYAETVDLNEKDVVRVKVGQTVEITPDALPEVTLKGEVERIALYPLERGGDVVYRVRVRLLESDERLRWGMTVDVRFPVE